MRRTRFLVSSLLAAGFTAHQDALAAAFGRATTVPNDPERGTLLGRFAQDHSVTLAQHRSHSSHSSHRSGYSGGHYSHTSHRSSSAGGYYPSYQPAPSYVPPRDVEPEPTPTPTPPAYQPLFAPEARADAPPSDGKPALSGRTKRFKSIVRRVQIALMAQDLYSGAIDGIVGPSLRGALRKFQKDHGLDATGTITPATLDALMVSSE